MQVVIIKATIAISNPIWLNRDVLFTCAAYAQLMQASGKVLPSQC